MSDRLTVKDKIAIKATLEKVWKVLTHTKFYKQWDELPEDYTEDELHLGSVIEWKGYSKMTVTGYEKNKELKMSLFLPRVDLKPEEYDVSYTYHLTVEKDLTIVSFEIGDFSPLPDAQNYFDATLEFIANAKKKIKDLAEAM